MGPEGLFLLLGAIPDAVQGIVIRSLSDIECLLLAGVAPAIFATATAQISLSLENRDPLDPHGARHRRPFRHPFAQSRPGWAKGKADTFSTSQMTEWFCSCYTELRSSLIHERAASSGSAGGNSRRIMFSGARHNFRVGTIMCVRMGFLVLLHKSTGQRGWQPYLSKKTT